MAEKATDVHMKVHLSWTRGGEVPGYIVRGASVVDGSMVYFVHGYTNALYAYDSLMKKWVWDLECPYFHPSLAMVKGFLTAIGGNEGDISGATNKLMSLVEAGGRKVWREMYPPMPSKRYHSSAVTTENTLIVAGGRRGIEQLETVEVMKMETLEWFYAKSLPHPMHSASLTVCGDKLYILGAHNQDNDATRSAFTSSVKPLLESSKLAKEIDGLPLRELLRLAIEEKAEGVIAWEKIADAPLTLSTCCSVKGQVLAVGGQDPITNDDCSAVYQYNPTSDQWAHISDLPDPCMWCQVAVVHGNKLIAVHTNKLYNSTAF